jgi:uncharacterized protein YndB with AHSA1/START domain
MRYVGLMLAMVWGALPASAEVIDVAASGMEMSHTVRIAVSPERVWDALVQPGMWWNSDHTFSGDAANMTFEPKVGGCWCETLPDGGALMHMSAGFIAPGKTLVLRGALGPLFDQGVEGAMAWTLTKQGDETEVSLTYRVGGYVKGGFEQWSGPVDGVLGEQIARLKQHVESGP